MFPKANGYYVGSQVNKLSSYYGSNVGEEVSCQIFPQVNGTEIRACDYRLIVSKADIIKSMTQKLNALGYKILPSFEIEKM
jgi:hypothetical protein